MVASVKPRKPAHSEAKEKERVYDSSHLQLLLWFPRAFSIMTGQVTGAGSVEIVR
jgi:hypothetical protein